MVDISVFYVLRSGLRMLEHAALPAVARPVQKVKLHKHLARALSRLDVTLYGFTHHVIRATCTPCPALRTPADSGPPRGQKQPPVLAGGGHPIDLCACGGSRLLSELQ